MQWAEPSAQPPWRCIRTARGRLHPYRGSCLLSVGGAMSAAAMPGEGHIGADGTQAAARSRQHERQEDSMQSAWKETMAGGSPQAERAEFEQLAQDIMRMQLKNAKTASAHGVPHGADRAFHAKSTLATDRAELKFRDDLPSSLSHGFAQPGRVYPVVVR